MMLEDTYSGRSVLVTGHTGFKGSWLTEWLVSLGALVTGYALDPPTTPSLFNALDLGPRIKHVVADVRDRDRLVAEARAASPSVIFHLAARALVRRAYEEPHDTFETNVMGTVNVLEAARACPSVRAVVIVTTDKVYQNLESGTPFRESDPLGGRDPYGASKGGAELVTAAYRESFFGDGAAIASVRAGNVIGGGDWAPDRIIPDSVRALVAGEPIVVRNPDAIRPWQHVLEPLSGYLRLGALLLDEGSRYAGAWNFGPTKERSDQPVRWVVDQFIAAEQRGPAPRGAAPEPRQRQSARAARMGAGLGSANRRRTDGRVVPRLLPCRESGSRARRR
jgi:CDP-glucose 4,6-dehydratase